MLLFHLSFFYRVMSLLNLFIPHCMKFLFFFLNSYLWLKKMLPLHSSIWGDEEEPGVPVHWNSNHYGFNFSPTAIKLYPMIIFLNGAYIFSKCVSTVSSFHWSLELARADKILGITLLRSGINNVIDVSMPISSSGIVRRESPFSINNKLVVMYTLG